MMGLRYSIAFRLLAGLACLVLLTAGAGGIALLALKDYQRALDEMAQQHLPALRSSSTLVQQTQKLVATAPQLIVAENQYERRGYMLRITAQKGSIDAELEALKRFGLGAAESTAISQVQGDLVENLNDLDTAVERKIDQDRRVQDLAQELRQLRERVHGLESNHFGDGGVAHLRDALSGMVSLSPQAKQMLDREIVIQSWLGRSDEILALLLTAFDAQNRGALDSIRVQLLDTIERITTIDQQLVGSERDAATSIVSELNILGLDGNGLLETRAKQLETMRAEDLALARNRLLADQLVTAVSGPQQRIAQEALELGVDAARRTRNTARNLIAIVVAGAIAAGVILIYIYRSVIYRLRRLQVSMQGRQAGHKTPIDTDGHDEIAEMAQALDFFVRTISEREAEKERALVELKAAQASLIQAEKLASLGQLIAGVAHEIQNPLNFVNNFSAVSIELCNELRVALDTEDREEQDETVRLLTGNLGKIHDHGARAGSIVQSMLAHSRQDRAKPEWVELNHLVDEAITLAWHGARGRDQTLRVTIDRDFAPQPGLVELVPQDVTRALLNILTNSFYAVAHRSADQEADAPHLVYVATSGNAEHVEVRVTDNGVGMTKSVLAKLFTPFFTTKPPGEGTGLGLSLSYDIVVRQHGGLIRADSIPGRETTIVITLPRRHCPPETAHQVQAVGMT